MNAKLIASSLVALSLAHGAAFADPADIDPLQGFVSTASRAEVRAEALAARAAGLIRNGEGAAEPSHANVVSTKTHAQVRAERRTLRSPT